MKVTISLSQRLNCSYFDVLDQETDDVIVLINFLVEDGKNAMQEKPLRKDDGFWDF